MAENKLLQKFKKHKQTKALDATKSNVSISELMGTSDKGNIESLINDAKNDNRFITLTADCFIPDPLQPRKTIDSAELDELRVGIESVGQIEPIVVRSLNEDGKHVIVVGERRWRAISGSTIIDTIEAVIVKDGIDEITVLKIQMQENNNRVNVNVLENAAAVMRSIALCLDLDSSSNDKKASIVLGVPRSIISKSRGICNAPEEIKALSSEGIVQDTDTIYELTKAFDKNPSATTKFIEQIRTDDVPGNVRTAAKQLALDTKRNTKKKKKTVPKTNKKIITEVKSVTAETRNKHVLVMSLNGSDVVYKFDEKAWDDLIVIFKGGE